MGEFPVLLDGSSLHEVTITRMFEKENGVYIDLDDIAKECSFIQSDNRLRSLFDEALRIFLDERSGKMVFRPVPVSCFDGTHVDLFKLFWVVRKIGGYDMVCSKFMWGFVVEQCGLASGLSAFLKLIYVRYLKEFDQWLWGLNNESNLDIQRETGRRFDILLQEIKRKFKELMRKVVENKIEGELLQLTHDENSKEAGLSRGGSAADLLRVGDVLGSREGISKDNYSDAKRPSESEKDLGTSTKRGFEEVNNEVRVEANKLLDEKVSAIEDSDFLVSAKRIRSDIPEVWKNSGSDTNYVLDGFCALSNDNMLLVKTDLEQGSDSQKLKRESFSLINLLDWIRLVAKHSDDPRIGQMPMCSKWENHVWLQAMVVRKYHVLKRNNRSSDDTSPLQMKLLLGIPTDTVHTRRSCILCKECLAAQVEVVNCQHVESGDGENERNNEIVPNKNKGRACDKKQVSETDRITYTLSYKSRTNDVLVGSEFQAEVPEWTGNVYESDSKWLGTRIWPPEGEETTSPLSLIPVGRGRESSCDCPRRNSVECVRFHIAEKRFALKKELGDAFFEWGFDKMGEEVSLSWEPEEEDKFKEVVSSNDSYIWKKLPRMFPSKTREGLVSYYFNVYNNQVRSYQNRTTPEDIDSDTEEKQCGTIGERFGYKALKAPNFCTLVCVENKQCFDLDLESHSRILGTTEHLPLDSGTVTSKP